MTQMTLQIAHFRTSGFLDVFWIMDVQALDVETYVVEPRRAAENFSHFSHENSPF